MKYIKINFKDSFIIILNILFIFIITSSLFYEYKKKEGFNINSKNSVTSCPLLTVFILFINDELD